MPLDEFLRWCALQKLEDDERRREETRARIRSKLRKGGG